MLQFLVLILLLFTWAVFSCYHSVDFFFLPQSTCFDADLGPC